MKTKIIVTVLVAFLCHTTAFAGPYTTAKNKACPEDWSPTDKTVPVVWSTTDPWSDDASDKEQAKAHLASAKPIETIANEFVTPDDLVNDPLTVASECMVYRNFEVDSWNYSAPGSTPPSSEFGWMPAAIF